MANHPNRQADVAIDIVRAEIGKRDRHGKLTLVGVSEAEKEATLETVWRRPWSVLALQWEDDQFFAGAQGGLATAEFVLGGEHVAIEAAPLMPSSETRYVVYHQSAMTRAVSRSYTAGGGVRGLSSQFLRPGEAIEIPAECSISDLYFAIRRAKA